MSNNNLARSAELLCDQIAAMVSTYLDEIAEDGAETGMIEEVCDLHHVLAPIMYDVQRARRDVRSLRYELAPGEIRHDSWAQPQQRERKRRRWF